MVDHMETSSGNKELRVNLQSLTQVDGGGDPLQAPQQGQQQLELIPALLQYTAGPRSYLLLTATKYFM